MQREEGAEIEPDAGVEEDVEIEEEEVSDDQSVDSLGDEAGRAVEEEEVSAEGAAYLPDHADRNGSAAASIFGEAEAAARAEAEQAFDDAVAEVAAQAEADAQAAAEEEEEMNAEEFDAEVDGAAEAEVPDFDTALAKLMGSEARPADLREQLPRRPWRSTGPPKRDVPEEVAVDDASRRHARRRKRDRGSRSPPARSRSRVRRTGVRRRVRRSRRRGRSGSRCSSRSRSPRHRGERGAQTPPVRPSHASVQSAPLPGSQRRPLELPSQRKPLERPQRQQGLPPLKPPPKLPLRSPKRSPLPRGGERRPEATARPPPPLPRGGRHAAETPVARQEASSNGGSDRHPLPPRPPKAEPPLSALLGKVKHTLANFPCTKAAWEAHCGKTGGNRNPSHHSARSLTDFMNEVEGLVTEVTELAHQVKRAKELSQQAQEDWDVYCASVGNNVLIPNHHSAEFLRSYLDDVLSAEVREKVCDAGPRRNRSMRPSDTGERPALPRRAARPRGHGGLEPAGLTALLSDRPADLVEAVTLLIGPLPAGVGKQELREYFRCYGEVAWIGIHTGGDDTMALLSFRNDGSDQDLTLEVVLEDVHEICGKVVKVEQELSRGSKSKPEGSRTNPKKAPREEAGAFDWDDI